jgi:hypothetical protein
MGIKQRLATLEQWSKDHPQVHALEQRAIEVARQETRERLAEHNNVLARIDKCVQMEWFERVHNDLLSRVSVLEKLSNEDDGRRGPIMGIIQWAATVIGAAAGGWLAGHFMH